MILIITDAFDVHADVVVEKLKNKSAIYFRLNIDVDSLHSTSITYEKGNWFVEQNSAPMISSNIKVVWCRRSSVSLTVEQEEDHSNGFRLWKSEWNRILFGMYSSLSSAFWLNHIRAATLSDNKFYQLTIASDCGLRVPQFITSNDRISLIDFSKKHVKVALKFMSQDLYRSSEGHSLGLYVNKLGTHELEEFGNYSENPVTLQVYIEKDFEVRYTFIDNDHLACRISSQESDRANIDWRRYDIPNTPHIPIEPDTKIKEKISNLMNRLDLSFGAIDFIVDKNGEWWFLEVNSSGQWLWIEDLAGLQISDRIAICLLRHGRESH